MSNSDVANNNVVHTDDSSIDIENFRIIDFWSKDTYTGATTVLYGGKTLHGVIEKTVPIQGIMKVGSYISIKNFNVTIISAGLYNKVKQAYERKR